MDSVDSILCGTGEEGNRLVEFAQEKRDYQEGTLVFHCEKFLYKDMEIHVLHCSFSVRSSSSSNAMKT